MPSVRSYRRRKPKGGYTTVRSFSRRGRARLASSTRRGLTGGARRKQRQRRLKKRGGKLAPGLKFNSSGQIVKDRNRRRVKTRRQKAMGKSPKQIRGRTRKRRGTGGVAPRRRRKR